MGINHNDMFYIQERLLCIVENYNQLYTLFKTCIYKNFNVRSKNIVKQLISLILMYFDVEPIKSEEWTGVEIFYCWNHFKHAVTPYLIYVVHINVNLQ